MNMDIVGISKLDGGYLISNGDYSALRVSWDDASFLIKKLLDDPKPKHNATLADIFGYKAQDNSFTQPSWVEDELKKN